MIKVRSLEVREIEYSYDKRPKISGMDDVVKVGVCYHGFTAKRFSWLYI